MNEVDTVLFDKTGTLTRERPEVGRVVACNGHEPEAVLRYAAAAEAKFAHPIAKAILHAYRGHRQAVAADRRLAVPRRLRHHGPHRGPRDPRRQRAVHGPGEHRASRPRSTPRSTRRIARATPWSWSRVDDALGGAIELQASVRPEVRSIIEGLRKRGIKHIAIISGDHDAPTRKLAESLGMDRYFAQVLPADKAEYVERLQKEGRKVCFVGDGINDSIALKKANVSISLRGATSIATDTAHIVFMEEGLSKLCDLRDIARDLDRNVKRSWQLILAPNGLCIAGAFTMGFGVMMSVLTNNVAALAALANGMLPLRRIAQAQADSQLEQDRRVAHGLAAQVEPETDPGDPHARGRHRDRDPDPRRIDRRDGRGGRDRGARSRGSMPGPTRTRSTSPSHPSPTWASASSSVRSKRTLDDELRRAILDAAAGRSGQLPFQAEFEWHADDPVLKLKSSMLPAVCGVRAGPDRRLRETLAGHADARHRGQSAAGDPVHRGDRR